MIASQFCTNAFRVVFFVLLIIMIGVPQPGRAQQDTPTAAPLLSQQIDQQNTRQTMAGGEGDQVQSLGSGGPDYYGYTYNTTAINWIDATSGTNAGDLSCITQPSAIPLNFSFKYFENTYTEIYLSRYGFLAFTPEGVANSEWCSFNVVPNMEPLPNNLIAPYWASMNYGTAGKVTYLRGGTAPNRYMVVEWSQMEASFGSPLTFEAILYESSNSILLQYYSMPAGADTNPKYFSGIEDYRGTDYLQYSLPSTSSGTAVSFTRPVDTGRVLVYPTRYTAFSTPGGIASFTISLKNIGDYNSDVYDLQPTCSWPVTLFDNATKNALMDTNSNTTIDTGNLAQGNSKTILVQIEMPEIGNVGMNNTCTLDILPASTPDKNRTIQLRTIVGAPFAEIDSAYNNNQYQMNFSIFDLQNQSKSSYNSGSTASPAQQKIVEMINHHFMVLWSFSQGCSGTSYRGITYSLKDENGNTIKVNNKEVNSVDSLNTFCSVYKEINDDPAIAVAPDGTIGVAISREIKNNSDLYLYNMFLVRLNQDGTILGTTQLTSNTTFYSSGDSSLVQMSTTTITATADNRFTVAWRQKYNNSGPCIDIFAGSWTTAGAQVTGPTALTSDAPGDELGYFTPSLTSSANKVMLVYQGPGPDIYYQVRDSALGSTPLKGQTNLTSTVSDYVYYPNVIGLSDGKFLAAWETDRIQYTIVDTSLNQVGGVQTLDKLSPANEGNVSLAADLDGHAILSWGERTENLNLFHNLYYALASSSGQTLTNSTVINKARGDYWIGNHAQNIAAHRDIPPTTNQVDLYLDGPGTVKIPPSTTTNLIVNLGNLGNAAATTVTVTMTKPNGLTFGTVLPEATCDASSCTWTFSGVNLGFQGSGVLTIPVIMGANSIGNNYQIDMYIEPTNLDAFTVNNHMSITVHGDDYHVFTPFISKK